MGRRGDPALEARIGERRDEFGRIRVFSRTLDARYALREYQTKPAEAVLQSVFHGDGAAVCGDVQPAIGQGRDAGADGGAPALAIPARRRVDRAGGAHLSPAGGADARPAVRPVALEGIRSAGAAEAGVCDPVRQCLGAVSVGIAAGEPARADRQPVAGGERGAGYRPGGVGHRFHPDGGVRERHHALSGDRLATGYVAGAPDRASGAARAGGRAHAGLESGLGSGCRGGAGVRRACGAEDRAARTAASGDSHRVLPGRARRCRQPVQRAAAGAAPGRT